MINSGDGLNPNLTSICILEGLLVIIGHKHVKEEVQLHRMCGHISTLLPPLNLRSTPYSGGRQSVWIFIPEVLYPLSFQCYSSCELSRDTAPNQMRWFNQPNKTQSVSHSDRLLMNQQVFVVKEKLILCVNCLPLREWTERIFALI